MSSMSYPAKIEHLPANGPTASPIEAVIAEAKSIIARGGPDCLGAGVRMLVDLGDEAPQHAALQSAVGKALFDAGTFDLAFPFLKQAVVLEIRNFKSWKRLATCLSAMKIYGAARIAIERAIDIESSESGANLMHGQILYHLEETDAAMAAFDQAIRHSGNNLVLAEARLEKGRLLESIGDLDGARDMYRSALQARPDDINAYFALSSVRAKFDEPDLVIATLEEAMARQNPDVATQAKALFTIGNLHAGQERYDKAFARFAEGNRLRSEAAPVPYRHEELVSLFDRLIGLFTPELLRGFADFGDTTLRHVFIVGMPRSGTTLTEAILAGHPQVKACGERLEMPQIADPLWGHTMTPLNADGVLVPDDGAANGFGLAAIGRPDLAALRDQYSAALSRHCSPDIIRVTDKLPFNFVHLGLISVFFPNARIIHCVRDPMDTCLSCFQQNFGDNLAFSNDLRNLGLYYGEYRRLMRHWNKVLPNPILEFAYEDVVADHDTMSRNLVAHVGLDWHDDCLGFDSAEAQVRTASAWQVRQNVYSSSIGKWRRYESHLATLKDALDTVV